MSNLVKIDKFLSARHTLMTQSAPPTAKITPERIQKIVVAACNADEKLAACTPESIWSSVQKSIQLGLEPCSPLGHSYLVPFKNKGVAEATLIVGYKGLLVLARRSGEIKSISVGIVRKGDLFKEVRGTNPSIIHEPDESHSGKPTHYYAVVHYVGGGETFEVLTVAEVLTFRDRSRASGSGPWVTDFDAMAIKTAIRRALKTAPLSADLADAIETDERNEIDVTPQKKAKSASESMLPPSAQTIEVEFASEGAAQEFAAIVGNDADPFAVAEGIAKGWAADPSIAKPAPVAVETPAAAASSPEADLIRERIEGMEADDYKEIAEDLKAAKARTTNAMPKDVYDNLASALLARRDALKKGGGK